MPKKEQMIGLRRGFELLELLARSENGLAFNEIKDSLPGVSPSSLSRLLKVMQNEQLTEHDRLERRYQVGERLKQLAAAVKPGTSTAERLQPILDRLARKTGCSSAFFEFDDDAIVMTAKSEPAEAFHYMAIGRRNDHFSQHGFAKVAMAFQDAKTQKRLIGNLPPELRISQKSMVAELNRIHRNGCLISLADDQPVIKRIVAPVFRDDGKQFAGSLGISFFHPSAPDQLDKLTEIVIDAARDASTKL